MEMEQNFPKWLLHLGAWQSIEQRILTVFGGHLCASPT